jgi:hypothetical protein
MRGLAAEAPAKGGQWAAAKAAAAASRDGASSLVSGASEPAQAGFADALPRIP